MYVFVGARTYCYVLSGTEVKYLVGVFDESFNNWYHNRPRGPACCGCRRYGAVRRWQATGERENDQGKLDDSNMAVT